MCKYCDQHSNDCCIYFTKCRVDRVDEHDLLMSIRNGEYLDENRQPISEFYDLLNEYEKRFEYAKENTSLPDKPDYKRINEFVMYVNERVVRGEI